jgi:hypothetical protein
MGLTRPSETDVWDLECLRLPGELVGDVARRTRPPRHRPGQPFVRGPISYTWLASASRLPGSGFRVAMAFRFLCCRYPQPNRWGLEAVAAGLQIASRSARRGLHAAELAGLVAVEPKPGCKLAVSVLDLSETGFGPERRPLYGPIPWSWWLPASRLAGRSLQVGAICWLLAGWERSAVFELALGGWANLGLSRFSASRGLDTLEEAELVSIARALGRSPVVTILDPEDSRGCRLVAPAHDNRIAGPKRVSVASSYV